ncbi:hypothetical protein SAMN05421784_11827 [Xenorhabdus koppenhoeferi]|uniref:Uncharacterized protein n=2 Tax=Xenorhabdus koppenhoeferi TaxID=351659 RepID=A0A1I7I5T2_9GAMM|nr:hypothetical protein SAMN05421784_11827 [Xenorhabdus koppenhoeferi]
MSSPNFTLLREVCEKTASPVVAGGGVSSIDDLCTLADNLLFFSYCCSDIGESNQILYTMDFKLHRDGKRANPRSHR